MDPVTLLIIAALVAGGITLGWVLGKGRAGAVAEERGRAAEQLRADLAIVSGERDAHLARCGEAERALAASEERARAGELLRMTLSEVTKERDEAKQSLATLRANADNFEEQKRLLLEAQETLKKEFENAGSKVLEKAQEAFLNRAQERFNQSEEKSAERIQTLLAPVGERLKNYEEQVASLEAKRVDAFGQLHGQIEALRTGQEDVRKEAARLGNSLRNAPKARGRWGEQQLRNVLEQCGLAEHTDFVVEQSINTDEGRLRPDAVVRIPGNKVLVIDAKVSLNAYQDAFDAEDEPTRIAHLDQHATSMRNHILALGSKGYQSQFEGAADYVLMFVPGEHFIAAALEQDSKLWDYAFERKVLLASPTNLVAIARTIAQVWQQDGLAKEAREIGKLGSDLYDSLAKTQDDLLKTGVHLGRAVNSFNDFSRTYEGNVLSRARRLAEKHIKLGKREIVEDVPHIEVVPRQTETQLLPDATPDGAEGDGQPN